MTIKRLLAAAFATASVVGAAFTTLPVAAAPIDHCKPRSACVCGWEIVDGKNQYVCRVKAAPR